MDRCVREARFWEPDEPPKVRCNLCAHRCHIGEGSRGICGVRENREGVLYSLVYGRLVSGSCDPIEKKPLFHLLPGSESYSIATAGCNLRCAHCQNYSISQVTRDTGRLPGSYVAPDEVVSDALACGAKSISYTYTEPTIALEYYLEVMELAHGAGLLNVFVTNGFMTPETVERLGGLLDAANIDLKAMEDDFYRKICGARLQPVLDTIKEMHRRKIWVEVTTLVIPGHNDSEEELRRAARFIASVDVDMPWHVTGFYPTYKLNDAPPTTADALHLARQWGLEEGLRYVYQGNRPGSGGEDTICPGCADTLVRRSGFSIVENRMGSKGCCPGCGQAPAGRFV